MGSQVDKAKTCVHRRRKAENMCISVNHMVSCTYCCNMSQLWESMIRAPDAAWGKSWEISKRRSLQWVLLNGSSCAWHTGRTDKPKCQSLEQRKVYCRAMQGDRCLPSPEPPEGFQQSVFEGKGSCRLLGVAVPCSCSCASRFGHHIPINLQ